MDKLKQYIFNHNIFSSLHRELYIKAFTAASKDLEETRIDDTDKKAKELADKMLSDLLSVVDEKQIITVSSKGLVFIGGEKIDDAYLASLKSEAELIESTKLWGIISETTKKLAEQAMFVNGVSLADFEKGRSMLYTLSTQKKIIDTVKSYQQKK